MFTMERKATIDAAAHVNAWRRAAPLSLPGVLEAFIVNRLTVIGGWWRSDLPRYSAAAAALAALAHISWWRHNKSVPLRPSVNTQLRPYRWPWPITLTFNTSRARAITHTRTKSSSLKGQAIQKIERNGQADEWTIAKAVGKYVRPINAVETTWVTSCRRARPFNSLSW